MTATNWCPGKARKKAKPILQDELKMAGSRACKVVKPRSREKRGSNEEEGERI